MQKFGSPEPISVSEDVTDPQGLSIEAIRREGARQDYDPAAVLREDDEPEGGR